MFSTASGAHGTPPPSSSSSDSSDPTPPPSPPHSDAGGGGMPLPRQSFEPSPPAAAAALSSITVTQSLSQSLSLATLKNERIPVCILGGTGLSGRHVYTLLHNNPTFEAVGKTKTKTNMRSVTYAYLPIITSLVTSHTRPPPTHIRPPSQP